MLSRSYVVFEEADDLPGVVDAEGFGTRGAADIDGGKGEAASKRCRSEPDQCPEDDDAGN